MANNAGIVFTNSTDTKKPVSVPGIRSIEQDANVHGSSSHESNDVMLPSETFNPKKSSNQIGLDLVAEKSFSEIFRFSEGTYIEPWRLTENVSARVIEQYDDVIVLECLIDKEAGIYEESEFKRSLFDGYSIEIGKLFKLSTYERKNEIRLQVKGNPGLVAETDFPQVDFEKKYGRDFFNIEA